MCRLFHTGQLEGFNYFNNLKIVKLNLGLCRLFHTVIVPAPFLGNVYTLHVGTFERLNVYTFQLQVYKLQVVSSKLQSLQVGKLTSYKQQIVNYVGFFIQANS